MRRILLLTPDFPPDRGGVARYLSAFADFFSDRIRVIAAPQAHADAFAATAAYPIQRRPLAHTFGPWPWREAVSILRVEQGNYDVAVVSHLLPYGTAAWIAKRFTGKPYAVIVHGMDVGLSKHNPCKRLVATIVLRGASMVIANSHALADEVADVFGVHAVVAYPPLTVPGGEPRMTTDGAFHLLTVARLVPRKGHVRALKAIAMLPKPLRERIRYDIVGDGPERCAIQAAVRELGLSASVALHPNVSDNDLPAFYARADLFVMPVLKNDRDREGFGMALIEAAAYGVPSIVTDMPGVDEAVIDCETGFLVRDGSVHSVSAAVEILMTVPGALDFLGRHARARVCATFSSDRQFGPLRNVL